MLTEKKEQSQTFPLNDEDNNKTEKKNNKEEKVKKKMFKRYPMEKTVDDTIKKINILLKNDVSYFLNFYLYCNNNIVS